MKKVICFVSSIIFIALIFAASNNLKVLPVCETEYYFQTNTIQFPSYVKLINNGSGVIARCDADYVESFEKEYEKLFEGKTLIYKNYCMEDIVKILDMLIVEQTENQIIGYTYIFEKCININGKKVNVQILDKNGVVFVGNPILLGSY